ncbi:MAG: LptF/LptG family permease [Bacteroidia bacterium]
MKLTKLDYYIIKRFLGAFLLALGLFTIIIIVFDLAEKIDDFIEHDAPFKAIILSYYVNWIPFLLNLFSPVFVFIAVIFFTSKMAQKSEIVAIMASGVSFLRLLVPYVITATFLAFLSFSLYAWIIPKADKTRVVFENEYIRERENYSKQYIKRQIRPGVIMTLETFNLRDSFGYQLNMERLEDGEIVSKLGAEKMVWNSESQSWQIKNYWIREFNQGKEYLTKGKTLDTMIQFNPEDFFKKMDDIQMYNMRELDEMIAMEDMRGTGNTFFYVTEKYKRFASPFAIIILTIIGVSVSARKSRGGIGLSLGVGVLLSFLYLIVIQFFNAYGTSGSMHALLATWIPNIIFGAVAFVLYRFAQK